MLWPQLLRWFALLGSMLFFVTQPASARRGVYDTWGWFSLSGYCSPDSAGTSDCAPYAMPFSVQMGGKAYSSFYVNSNGTVSFGSIESFLAPQNTGIPYSGPPPQTSLSAYSVPIFSPNFSDGPGYFADTPDNPVGFDGNFAALTSVGNNSFTVSWFSCPGYPLSCGLFSWDLVASATFDPNDMIAQDLQGIILDNATCVCFGFSQQAFESGQQNLENAILQQEPIYTMTLTDLANGFRVDYSYDAAAIGQTGVYGFSLPSGTNQITGPLEDRSYFFNPVGHWRQRGDNSDEISQLAAVPEPSTWMMFLSGFAMLAIAIRRKRRLQAA